MVRPRFRGSVLLIWMSALLVTAITPGSSVAGVYKVRACDAAEGLNNSWRLFSSRAAVAASVACPSNGSRRRGLSAHNVVARGSARKTVKRGTGAALVFNAPAGTSIVGIRAGYYFYRADSSWQAFLSADLQPIKGCYRGGGECESTATNRFVRTPPSSALYIGVVCVAAKCPTSPTGDSSRGSVQAMATLYSATVSLEDNSKPTLDEPTGSLLSEGWKSGTQDVHVGASDNSGISQIRILNGQASLVSQSSACDLTQLTPCPSGGGDFVVDTSTIKPDGPHTLTFEVRDAGGNIEQLNRDVLIDNTAPGPAEQLAADVGDRWSRTNSFNVTWRNPAADGGAPIVGAEYELCPASGGACQPGSLDATALTSLDGLAVPGRGEWVLRMWLRDGAGNADRRTAPEAIRLRFDDEAPQAAFLPEDPDNPTQIAVQVTDEFSGLASGTIEIKKSDGTAWRPLDTRVADGRLIATLDDTNLAAGVYQLRAWANDQAGNVAATATRADGTDATLTLPLRLPTRLRVGAVSTVRGRHGKRREVLLPTARTRVGRDVELGGHLTSGNGNPIAGSDVLVLEFGADGVTWVPVATLRTSRKGRFHYRAPAGISRAVRFAYAGTPTIRAAEADVPLRVRAFSKLTVNRRALRNGQTAHFIGHLKGGFVPTAGKLVELQVRIRHRWQTFTTFRTDPQGNWQYDYRFTGTRGRVPYTFRVRVPGEATYPYVAGLSRQVKVVVRG